MKGLVDKEGGALVDEVTLRDMNPTKFKANDSPLPQTETPRSSVPTDSAVFLSGYPDTSPSAYVDEG